jgi:hypothetical protein
MYNCILGMAVMYFTQSGISWIRHRFLMPRDFIAGVIARQIVDFDLVGSATTRFALILAQCCSAWGSVLQAGT